MTLCTLDFRSEDKYGVHEGTTDGGGVPGSASRCCGGLDVWRHSSPAMQDKPDLLAAAVARDGDGGVVIRR
jgi:hypothetical protein